MKSNFVFIACLVIAGCDFASRPSDEQLRSALIAKMQSTQAPQESVERIKGGEIGKVSCAGSQSVTCNFDVGGVGHVAVFGKTGDGVWTASSVD